MVGKKSLYGARFDIVHYNWSSENMNIFGQNVIFDKIPPKILKFKKKITSFMSAVIVLNDWGWSCGR